MAALVNDDRIPNEISNIVDALNIANRKLISKYGTASGSPVRVATREGSANTVDVYKKQYGGKMITYAVRMGKDPSFKIKGDGYYQKIHASLLPDYKAQSSIPNVTKRREEFLNETKESEENWLLADEKGLSPELYFYGYIKQGNNLVLCTISEAFNMDLNGFIRAHGFGNAEMQKNIAGQLVNLFNEMAKDMTMICFDIKPQNTVIKFDQDENGNPILNENFIIKLIDWDADWCRNYKPLRSRDQVAGPANQQAAATIMIMVMANFFFYYYGNNILMDHMKTFYDKDSNQRFIITKVMMNLFEAGILSGVNTTEFSFMASHYFRMNFPSMRAIPDQSKFLTEMFKRSLCKNQLDYESRASSIELTLRGGKKKKRKTRRKYNRKTKKPNNKYKKKQSKSRIKKKRGKRKTKKHN